MICMIRLKPHIPSILFLDDFITKIIFNFQDCYELKDKLNEE